MTGQHATRRLLLKMACAAQPADMRRLDPLDRDAWDDLARMAVQHRLDPLLYARYGTEASIPEDVRSGWRAGHRYWACNALALALELKASCALLESHGFAPIALKGAFLAWHTYPDPALRPLRDIDLLLEPSQAQPAFDVLRAAGYARGHTEQEAHASNAAAARTKHLDPLVSPRGNVIELHQQLWESDGALDHRLPADGGSATAARAIVADGIRFPAAEDMLVHLIVHAVYSHRMDCGPLLVWDVHHLLRRYPIDWERFWRRSQTEGWSRGAALVVALVRQQLGAEALPHARGEAPPPPNEVMDAMPDLLLQDLDTRRSAGVGATALSGGRRALAKRIGDGWANATPPGGREPGIAQRVTTWAGPRLHRTLRELGRKAVRHQAKDLATLSAWLSA